jgi:hypothetical protein
MTAFEHFAKNDDTVFPLSGSSSAIETADPFSKRFLIFARDVLRYHLNAKFAAAIAAHNALYPSASFAFPGNSDGYAVGNVYPFDIAPYLSENQTAFPAIAFYPTATEFRQRTIGNDATITTYTLDYVFPPMTSGLAAYLMPFLNSAVPFVLKNRLHLGYDPNVNDGYSWGEGLFSYLKVKSAKYEEFNIRADNNSDNLVFPVMSLDIEVEFIDSWLLSDWDQLTGVDATIHNGLPDANPINNFMNKDIDL